MQRTRHELHHAAPPQAPPRPEGRSCCRNLLPRQTVLDHLIDNRLITLHGLLVFAGLAIYVVGSRARGQRRHPSAAIAWVVSLGLMPYVALPLYLLFGNRKVVRSHLPVATPESVAEGADAPMAPAASFLPLARAMGLPEPAPYRDLAVHQDGQQALQVLRDMLHQAQHNLDLSTFLVGADVFGHELTGVLKQRARDGLRVRLLIDGVGVYLGGRIDIRGLRAAGVQVALFVSPLRSVLPGRTNLRNHRKLVIADGSRAWSGGRNLAAEYFVGDPSHRRHATPWIDLSFDFTGALAQQMQQRFEQDWCFATGAAMPLALAGTVPPATEPGVVLAQLVPSGPDQRDDTLYVLLVSACFTARSRILAVSPYFVPDAVLLMALSLAARRHVVVDLVLPRHSNHKLADLARHAALRELTAAGGRVWLVAGMVHAKAVVVDDDLALVGSANLDERSLFLNYELTVAFRAPADVARFSAWIDRHRMTAERYRGDRPGVVREMVEGLVRWLAFQL